MNISKKWRVAAASALAVALVAGGTVSANAADSNILPVQSNGSQGSFYVWDGATGEYADIVSGSPAPVYSRSSDLIITGSATDVSSEIIIPAGTPTPTGAYRFIAKQSELSGGKNTWRAFNETFPTGPTGGLVYDNFGIDPKPGANNGGIESVFSEGGEWLVGVAFTINNGVTPVASVYRTMTVNAANDTYTLSPVETQAAAVAPAITTQPTSASVTAGANAEFTAAASGTAPVTVKWESSTNGTTWADVAGATSATLTVPAVTLAQSGTQYRAVFTNSAGSATTNSVQLTVSAAIVEPTDAANAATKKTIAAPVDATVTINGVTPGTYTAYAWSTPTNLGTVVVPASGIATIPVPAELQDDTEHTFALLQANNEIVAWGSVLVEAPEFPLTSATPLTADVTVSGKFALEGVNAGPIPLGTAKRGATTTPVALGAFTVTDDRDDLKGWTLNSTVTAFTNAASETIPGTALGLAPKKVGGAVDGISTTAAKVAGDPWTSTLVAEGIAGSYTPEAGTQFDADLTFKAPANAKKGTYTSTLTLTLASK